MLHSSYNAFKPAADTLDLLGAFFLVFTDVLFIADIFLNFFTGVAHKHEDKIDYKLSSISKHYLSSWFWLDAAACIPFDCLWLLVTGELPWSILCL